MQAEGLTCRGHQAAIAYGIRPETPSDVDLRARIAPEVTLFPTPWTHRSAAAQARAASTVRNLVVTWKPDVVHCQSSFAGLVGSLAVPSTVPTVYSPQGYSFGRASEPALKRLTYRVLEGLVAARIDVVGSCSFAEAIQARTVGAHRVAVVENGIPELNADLVQPLEQLPARAEPVVIAVGRISDQRRPEACARILTQLTDVARVAWVGGGDEDSRGMQALKQGGIEVTGWLPRDEILERLDEASVYLHWTGWDGLPLSILEALARNVVVIASDIGPNREVLGPSQVCSRESDAVAKIRYLLSDPAAQQGALESQSHRRAFYSADRMVTAWEELYYRLIEEGRDAFRHDLRVEDD